MLYDPESQDLTFPRELRLLKWHYIGWKKTQTMRLPNEIFHWGNSKYRELMGRDFSRDCAKCDTNKKEILSLLIATGIGDS